MASRSEQAYDSLYRQGPICYTGLSLVHNMMMSTDMPDSNRDDLASRVDGVLDLMRPAIKEDGGDVELVDVTDEGLVRLRFLGACVSCPSSSHTLHQGIERLLKERIPVITGVEAIA